MHVFTAVHFSFVIYFKWTESEMFPPSSQPVVVLFIFLSALLLSSPSHSLPLVLDAGTTPHLTLPFSFPISFLLLRLYRYIACPRLQTECMLSLLEFISQPTAHV